MSDPAVPFGIDPNVPNVARIYDWLLDGKTNFPADRDAARAILEVVPDARLAVRANRGFLRRAVRFLAADAGVRQFLDIGAGLPTKGNVHEVAQQFTDAPRVVYVDNDPVVVAHSQSLLLDPHVVAIEGDLREPDEILSTSCQILDFTQPIALLLLTTIHFVADSDEPLRHVARLCEALPPGSYLVISHGTSELISAESQQGGESVYKSANTGIHSRSREQLLEFFAGMDLQDPGLEWVSAWRPDAETEAVPASAAIFLAAVGRKR